MNLLQHSLVLAIRVYRLTGSPAQLYLFGAGSGCRFSPTCSVYAAEAIVQHGALTGTWLSLKRLARCHPWAHCGHDPVPAPDSPRLRDSNVPARAELPSMGTPELSPFSLRPAGSTAARCEFHPHHSHG